MKKANILKNNSKVLKLYAKNTIPHNIIFFDDKEFMKHVKIVLSEKYHITSLLLDKEIDIKSTCNIGNWEYDENMIGFLYISSYAIIDPDRELNDYFDRIYEKEITIEL